MSLVLEAAAPETEPGGGRRGDEQIRPVADAVADAVLQESVSGIDRGTVEVLRPADPLGDRKATVKYGFEIEVLDAGAGHAFVVKSRAGWRGPELSLPGVDRRIRERLQIHRRPRELLDRGNGAKFVL
jgi:hypothetical protein